MHRSILILLCSGLLTLKAQEISPRVIRDLSLQKEVPVLIELKAKADLSDISLDLKKSEKAQLVFERLFNVAKGSQSHLIEILKSRQITFHSFFLVNVVAARITKEDLAVIALLPEVKSILLDESISLDKSVDRTLQKLSSRGPLLTWGITRIEADQVWSMGYEGQGVTVAGEDTGYKWDLEGIQEKYRGYNQGKVDHNYNWHDAIHSWSPLSADSTGNRCGFDLKSPCDDNDHGTHTMGTMVGSTETDAYGVAPKANWIGCRNMERGNGSLTTYIECFEFFLAPTDLNNKNPKPELSPSVINNSWYCALEEGCDTSNFKIMEEVVNNLTTAGIVVVVSAGNSGQACGNIAAPAAIYESSLVVGAFANDDNISGFSSSGPVLNFKKNRIKPDVVAPGSDIVSRIPAGILVGWNGTSMAGPHVAGLVALIINANPALNGQVEKIKKIIKESARTAEANIDCLPFDKNAVPNHVYGFGKIMAKNAVRLALLTSTDNRKNQLRTFELIPNFIQNKTQILDSDPKENNTFEILDILGHPIQSIKPVLFEIDLTGLLPGTYFLHKIGTPELVRFCKF